MPVKTKFSLAGIRQNLVIKKIKKQLAKELPGPFREKMLKLIEGGRSPVEGVAKFQGYSPSYKEFIKRLNKGPGASKKKKKKKSKTTRVKRVSSSKKASGAKKVKPKKKKNYIIPKSPTKVNLKLTGDLHKSLFVKAQNDSSILVGFNNELADIHNRLGAGKSKVIRPILPTQQGQIFKRDLRNLAVKKLREITRKVVEKLNRR